MRKNIHKIRVLFAVFTAIFAMTACKDYTGAYQMTDGLPVVYYARPTNAAYADSLLVGAYMDETICLVGDNLTSIKELYFNDVKALLNINFITKNTLIVTVPRKVPTERLDKIIMKTGDGQEATFDFITRIPAPAANKLYCEYVKPGGKVMIIGNYFFDYDDSPIEISIGSTKIPHSDIIEVTQEKVSFKAPAADVTGPISIKTLYGNGRTKAIFRDSRGLITGFEPTENGGTGFVPGWGRPAHIENDPALACNGYYVRMQGSLKGEGAWESMSGDNTVNIWSKDNTSNPNADIPNPMFTGKPEEMVLKLEVNVVQAWTAAPMVFMFADANDLEGWLWGDTTYPRAIWAAWKDNGEPTTDGWETIAIPLKDMKYDGGMNDLKRLPAAYGQLGICIHNRGAEAYVGTACEPIVLIDNVRVVPAE